MFRRSLIILGAVGLTLAITTGAFAAKKYLITSSSQIKPGAISYNNLSADAKRALRGANGTKSVNGAQGAQGPAGPKGTTGESGAKGEAGPPGTAGKDGAPGKDGKAGFSPTAFGPYASDSPDSSICGNDWANDKMDRSYVVYPQVDGSFLVAETFTNGTFRTVGGNSPQDNSCGSTVDDVAGGVTGSMKGYFLVKVPADLGNFDPEAKCTEKCYTKDFVQAFFGISSYDVPAFELHYSSPSHGDWKNASDNRGGNEGNIN